MVRTAARFTLLVAAFSLLIPAPAGALPLDHLASRLTAWWTSLWGDAGCSVDPYGTCRGTHATTVPSENLDNGCGMDPYGTCGHGS